MIYFNLEDGLTYDLKNGTFNESGIKKDLVFRFLKGKYSTKEILLRDFLKKGQEKRDISGSPTLKKAFLDDLLEIYEDVKPFTYREAFELEDEAFKAEVFGTVDITDMIKNLGHERIETEGKKVSRKQYDNEGNFTGMKEYDVIFETHRINGEKLGITRRELYAVRCWCTSTNEEHWIWIEQQYKDKPLEAIASTFRIAKNLIPYVKEIKRQGDVLLVELTEDIKPEGEETPLTADQYFEWLTAES